MFCSNWLAEDASVSRDGPPLCSKGDKQSFKLNAGDSITLGLMFYDSFRNSTERVHTLLNDSRILSYWDRRRQVRDTWKVCVSVLGSRPLCPHRDSLRQRGGKKYDGCQDDGVVHSVMSKICCKPWHNMWSAGVHTDSLFRLVFISSMFVSACPWTERPWM